MSNFDKIYKSFISDKNSVQAKQMANGKFYLIKEYIKSNGEKRKYNETTAPIVFVLYKSVKDDLIHAVKVSTLSPNIIGKFFGQIINEETGKVELKKEQTKKVYKDVISKIPNITNESYRTYNISGLKKVIELKMDIEDVIPKNLKKNKK